MSSNTRLIMQEITNMLVDLAGNQKLPQEADISEKVLDQSKILEILETSIFKFTSEYPNFAKSLHDKVKKQEIMKNIIDIINEYDFEIKDSYTLLWESYILNSVSDADKIIHLNKLKSKIVNKKMITYIENEIRTPSKVTNIIKKILFTPLFVQEEESLSEAEKIIKKNKDMANKKYRDSVDNFLQNIEWSDEDNLIVNQFFNCVRLIEDDEVRNKYYNDFLQIIISELKKPTRTEGHERILIQIYLYLLNNEANHTVNPASVKYVNEKGFDWFTYQITKMPYQLYPHWNFNTKQFVLDMWQKHCIQNIYNKNTIVLSLPTSAGKTIISTAAIRKFMKIWYIVPTEPLALQLTGIILSSLIDIEKRAGQRRRNVTLALKSLYYKRITNADDIIIATPDQMFNLISQNKVSKDIDYVIIDEFHNMVNDGIGPNIEAILLFASCNQIPTICLSATIPNFDNVKQMMETRFTKPVFGVSEKKRFFNQERFMIKNLELVKIDPLQHISIETLRSNEFTHIGLPPTDVYNLYKKLTGVPRIDEKEQKFLKLDDVHKLECDIFAYLKTQSNEILSQVIASNPIVDDQLSIYELFLMLKKFNTSTIKPMIIFTMDSQKCMDRFEKLLTMVKEYESLVYGGYQGDQGIIQEYFSKSDEKCASLKINSNVKADADGDEVKNKEYLDSKKDDIRISMFESEGGYRDQLKDFYKLFIDTVIEQKFIDDFNSNYGSDLTAESIKKLRNTHAVKEFRKYSTAGGLHFRNKYAPHPECRLIDNDIAPEAMRKIKKKINNELQREILIQNQIKEDLASLQSAQSPNYAIQDEADIPEEETKEDGKIDNDEMSLINYDHPFMRGLEFGILGYNKLMNPALQRVSQYLINKYPFITFSDESLAVGINYPIKTVMLLGGLKGEPLEAIDNALAHQAIGRAGRRGLDIKSVAIYSGVIIEDILIQKYKHIIPNDVEMIASMFESDDMKNYVRTNTRPVPPPPPAQAPPTTKPTPKPIVNISSQTTISDNVGIGSGGGTSSAIEIDFGNFESWEDAADALDSSS